LKIIHFETEAAFKLGRAMRNAWHLCLKSRSGIQGGSLMWQKIITTFFFGQVALEHAVEASKKRLEAARDKAKADKKKAGEDQPITVVAKVEQLTKVKFARLRSLSEPVEKTCLQITKFLGETAEIKSKLAANGNS
jgi:hypothetical protein